jgi:hypothetical protein
VVTPELKYEYALAKMRLSGHGGMRPREDLKHFQMPFNRQFMPAEYAGINCCPLCTVGGGYLPGGGGGGGGDCEP